MILTGNYAILISNSYNAEPAETEIDMKVALAGRWHVHADEYAEAVLRNPDTQITAVWDPDKKRSDEWGDKFGCPSYSDFERMLAREDIDGVVIASQTSLHPHLMLCAARNGKHIFTEKALAIRPSDALSVKRAVEKENIKFVISFPHKSRPAVIYASNVVKGGSLGRITYARVRNVHNGSSAGWLPEYFYDESLCGGGAMIDLGAHPMYTLPMLLGKPLLVQSLFTDITGRGVEDNAVSVIEFENGATGVSETGFVSSGNPYTLEISGTDGYLCIRGNEVFIADGSTGGRLTVVSELPAARKLPIDEWIDWCVGRSDKPEGNTIEDAYALTALTYASYKAAKTGEKTYVNF